MNGILTDIGLDPEIMILCLTVLVVVLLVMTIVLIVQVNKSNKKYQEFMQGKDAKSLEDTVTEAYRQIDELTKNDQERKEQNEKILQAMENTFQKVGIVKYDAFKEMGGKLSFSLALLDQEDTGFVLNVMHSREACYTYVKEIIKGESYIALGDEEKEALDKAMYEED